MNHLAFHVPQDKFDEYRQKLKDKGVQVGPVLNHDDSPLQVPRRSPRGVRAIVLLHRPDGVTLEFACWTKGVRRGRQAPPRTAADRKGAGG